MGSHHRACGPVAEETGGENAVRACHKVSVGYLMRVSELGQVSNHGFVPKILETAHARRHTFRRERRGERSVQEPCVGTLAAPANVDAKALGMPLFVFFRLSRQTVSHHRTVSTVSRQR